MGRMSFWKAVLSNWNSGTAASEMASSHQALIGGIAYGGYARKVWTSDI